MSDGIGCECAAHHEGECCCDVDWTPQETIDLRAEIAELKRQRWLLRDALNSIQSEMWIRDKSVLQIRRRARSALDKAGLLEKSE